MGESKPGLTPLMQAAKEGWVEAVMLLLEAKASLYAKDEDGMQPLHFAASAGCFKCCIALLDARAAPWEEDDLGRDAYACLPQDRLICGKDRTLWVKLLKKNDRLTIQPVHDLVSYIPINTCSPKFARKFEECILESETF